MSNSFKENIKIQKQERSKYVGRYQIFGKNTKINM